MTVETFLTINRGNKKGFEKDKILSIEKFNLPKNSITLSNKKTYKISDFVNMVESGKVCVRNPSRIKYWEEFDSSLEIGTLVKHKAYHKYILKGVVKEKVANSIYLIRWTNQFGHEWEEKEHFLNLILF